MLQRIMGEAVTRYWVAKTGGTESSVVMDVSTNLFAFPPYVEDPIISVLQQTLPFLLVLSFILSVIVNTKNLVYEKEKKLKVFQRFIYSFNSSKYILPTSVGGLLVSSSYCTNS